MHHFARLKHTHNYHHLLAALIGIAIPLLLWFTLRERYLGIRNDVVLLTRGEPLDVRLFTYVVFGVGMTATALLAQNKHRWYMAPLAGGLGYIVLVAYMQHLFINPDIWKFWERGHAMRLIEIIVIGLILGLCVTNYRRNQKQDDTSSPSLPSHR